MIEKTEVSGRPALVHYLASDMTPAEPAGAYMARVLFDDGDTAYLMLQTPVEPKGPAGP